jgi:hypothetical protein
MPRKHDWEAARRDYVQGYEREDGSRHSEPTYAEIAKRTGISGSMMRKKGADENWAQQRNMFQSRMEHATQGRRIDVLADRIVQFDSDCASTATELLGMIRKKMEQAVIVDEEGVRQVTTADLQTIASALVKVQAVGRLAMGESTENVKSLVRTITLDLGTA